MENKKAIEVKKRWEKGCREKATWNQHWDEVAKYVIPRKDNVYGQAVAGEKKTSLFDTEAIRANDDMSAAFHSLLTSPSTVWYGLGIPGIKRGQVLNKDDVQWFHTSVSTMIDVLNGSNFQVEIAECYQDLGSIGTTVLRMEEDEDDTIRFYSHPIYTANLKENFKGDVKTVSRMCEYDEDEMFELYGDAIEKSDELKRMMKSNNGRKFKVIHEVGVRSQHEIDEGEGIGSTKFPFYSIHVLESKAILLKESGYEEWPYATPRITKINTETYGRSPAMKVLADIKMLNTMKKVTIQSAQLNMAPPIQAIHNSFLAPLDLTPFGVNYRRGGEKAEPLFTGSNIQFSIEILEYIKSSIKEAFFVDKLKTVVGDRATATEVIQKRDEQFRFLGPILSRLDRELLKPVIDRLFGICLRKGLFEELPSNLASIVETNGGKIKIEYLSPIAQAQKAVLSENITRAISATAPIAQAQPEILDNIDGDKLLKKNFEIFNVSPDVLRSDADVAKIRKSRQEAMQRQAELESGNAEADTIKKMSEAERNGQGQQTQNG